MRNRLFRRVARFHDDRRGAIAVIFALALLPTLGLVGAVIDYGTASAKKAKLQRAIDGVALALIPRGLELSDEELRREGKEVFARLMPDVDPERLRVEIDGERIELTVIADDDHTTHFRHFLGMGTVTVGASAKARVANTTYEIALVVDNSTSMADMAGGRSKMDAAKEAANGLVDAIFAAPGMASRTQIAVVPYTSSVRVGAEYQTATWVDSQGVSPIHWENIDRPTGATSRFALFDWLGEPWGGCFESRPDGLALTDEAPSAARPTSLFVPMFAPDEPGNKGLIRWSNPVVLNSYLNDDGQGACASVPSGWNATQKLGCKYRINRDANKIAFPSPWAGYRGGPNFMCNAVKMLRLSDTASTVRTKVGEMTALGDTSIFEGIAWGWRALSPNAPLADGRAYDRAGNRKVIILLSDGNNNWLHLDNPNRSLYAPMGFWKNDRLAAGLDDQTEANELLDAKTTEVCGNAKAAGVVIYTVGFKLPGQTLPQSWSDLITNCASDVDGKRQAFIAENGDALIAIFQEIARNILKPRISS
jgi:Flp pilus assembly protein TadG